ncbi:lysophospholipid acyltransferase family protein [Lyngbya sp. CCY1209]|uniref:lysophospholipid acyltransferase family protein n=1 Tax=Lyngbya sp. CCY1209 TaxID=2886103 RepID=UPI002D2135AF|nr:1-acyl-sn-glycerol-3-phosphate acyltransferase [Lyngbya sp. CCY1209]
MMTLESIKPLPAASACVRQTPADSGVSPWLSAIVYPLSRWGLLPFYFRKIEVKGRENLPRSGPVILAPTHRSRWDAFIVPYAAGPYVTGRHSRFMVTADEMRGPQGWLIRKMGGFAVNQKHPAIATVRHGVDLLRRGEMLVIFPEGNIFRDRQVHELKPGLARLALQAESHDRNLGVKVVPMSLHYDPIVPRWRTKVEVKIGVPLEVSQYAQGSPKQAAQNLMGDLGRRLVELDGE